MPNSQYPITLIEITTVNFGTCGGILAHNTTSRYYRLYSGETSWTLLNHLRQATTLWRRSE